MTTLTTLSVAHHDRAVRETNERMRQALAALDWAQAAQPEGEPR